MSSVSASAAVPSVSPFRADLLAGRRAFITGGGSGIGRVIAEVFGEHGAAVCLFGRTEAKLRTACEELGRAGVTAHWVSGDVRDPQAVLRAVDRAELLLGGLDIVVNGAAGNFLCKTADLSSNAFRTVLEIDTVGTFNVSKAALEPLKKTRGVIVNLTAALHYGQTPYQVHASAAKAGVDAMTRQMGVEWAHDFGVRTVGIAPGPIADTEGMARLGGGQSDEQYNAGIPMHRMGTKREIAYAAVYLVSDAASYITGETLVVDGGCWLARPPTVPYKIYEKHIRRAPKSRL